MEDRLYDAVHQKPYNHLEEEAFLKEACPDLYGRLLEEVKRAPEELVREYGLDCVYYYIKRDDPALGGADAFDEDAVYGIFRLLGKIWRIGMYPPEGSMTGEEEETFLVRGAAALYALESGHLHPYEANLVQMLSLMGKGEAGARDKGIFLALIKDTMPCLSSHLIKLRGADPEGDFGDDLDILRQAPLELAVQVCGKTRCRILARAGEPLSQAAERAEKALLAAGYKAEGFEITYVPGRVINFWKQEK